MDYNKKYLKYKNKYLSLKLKQFGGAIKKIPFKDSQQKYSFVFDFDKTLVNVHTNGQPTIPKDIKFTDFIPQIFGTQENYSWLFKTFTFLKQNGHSIFINTRGSLCHVMKFVDTLFPDLIDEIYGSKRINEINPIDIPSEQWTLHWANRKLEFCDEIKNKNPEKEIIFFDDTKINCDVVFTKYKLVFHIKTGTSGLINALNNIIN